MTIEGRKVVQISSLQKTLAALCADGSMWVLTPDVWGEAAIHLWEWKVLPSIPAAKGKKEKP